MVLGAGLAIAAFAGVARDVNSPAPAFAEIERIIELAGLGITQVSLTGHRYTPDSDIFDALDLASSPTMLSFDSRAAQRRIESLPWVERASVERVLPDRLDVHVVERAPYAVWRLNGRHFLVDKAGRVLATVPSDAMPTLPRVAGEGAAIEAVRLYELLGSRPGLTRQVEIGERVGGRRWTLHLSGGSTLQLPAQGEAEAIERGLQIAKTRGAARSEIDLRVPGRPLVRAPSTGGEKAPQDGVATGGI